MSDVHRWIACLYLGDLPTGWICACGGFVHSIQLVPLPQKWTPGISATSCDDGERAEAPEAPQT